MLDKAEEFKSQRIIESLKRTNMPFYYLKPEEIVKLRKAGLETEKMEQRIMVKSFLSDYN
jgi:hypothetical protein